MKEKITVYREYNFAADISQLPIKRDWMENTYDRHAYQCLPISLANTLGWGIYFPEDISFVWDGVCDTTPNHIKVLKGEKYCSTARGNATISFVTFLHFITNKNTTTLVMPVPNEFNESAQCYTNLISTSFYKPMLPVSWRITKPNVEITIPAGKPIAAILPISLKNIENFELEVLNKELPENHKQQILENMKKPESVSKEGFTHFYRKAENYKGESVGEHEAKSIRLKTKYF